MAGTTKATWECSHGRGRVVLRPLPHVLLLQTRERASRAPSARAMLQSSPDVLVPRYSPQQTLVCLVGSRAVSGDILLGRPGEQGVSSPATSSFGLGCWSGGSESGWPEPGAGISDTLRSSCSFLKKRINRKSRGLACGQVVFLGKKV